VFEHNKKEDNKRLTGSEQVEKIANNNGFGSAISKLIRTSFFAVVSMFISFNEVSLTPQFPT